MRKAPKKICVFTSTRADYGLLYWLIKEIHNLKDFELELLVSGSHLSHEFGYTFDEIKKENFLNVHKVEMLLSSNTKVGIAKSAGICIIGCAEKLAEINPKFLVVLGDRYETLGAAQVALYLGIPLAHIHGGELTAGAYDDSIRHAITKMSNIHFCSSETHKKRIIQMGEIPSSVYNFGAIGLDNFNKLKLLSKVEITRELKFNVSDNFFLITYHPVTRSVGESSKNLLELLEALEEFSTYKVVLTYPNADNESRELIKILEQYHSRNPDRSRVYKSMGQIKYLSAMINCDVIIGNSSSGIIEAPTAGVPTVNIGDRQEGREAAKSVIHCSTAKNEIVKAIKIAIATPKRATHNPYGNGSTTEKIIEVLKTANPTSKKKFHDLKDFQNG